MKKILILIIGCLLLVGCGAKEENPYTTINYQEYMTLLDKKETFILVIGQYDCSRCVEFNETLKEVVKNYDIDIKYIDVKKMNEENEEHRTAFDKTITYTGTPTTVFFEEGEQSRYNRIEGAKNYDYVIEKLKQNGYIQ